MHRQLADRDSSPRVEIAVAINALDSEIKSANAVCPQHVLLHRHWQERVMAVLARASRPGPCTMYAVVIQYL